MKTTLVILALCFLTIAVKAQSKQIEYKLPATVVMPDGSIVPSSSMDSIKKVFGGRDAAISVHDDGTAYVHPAPSKSEMAASEAKLNSHLDQPAPDFSFKGMDGKTYSSADLKGKTVVLNFWFTACGGCVMEMPDLNELKKNYAGKDVVFLAVTFDDNTKVESFLAKTKFDYTIIPNAKKMCNDYNIYGYPTSMVINAEGIVKFINCSIDTDIKTDLAKAITNNMH